jgi:hypothetical protein
MFILTSELSFGTVGYHLNLSMRVKGPDSPRRKGIVIEDTQGTEVHVFTVMILVEREMPAAKERTTLDGAMGSVNSLRFANHNLIFHDLCSLIFSIEIVCLCS